jgi:Rad3-related DNA helicase
MDRVDLLAHFRPGLTPRREQAHLLASLADALAEALDDPSRPRVFVVEAPPGVGKSHIAMALAHWSGDAYLLTSQKLLQDQYEREFGSELQVVKGRDNYECERYPQASVPTSRGMCRRPRGPLCQCPYARAKAAALAGPLFCTNVAYFATLRYWRAEQLRKRRLLVVDEAHGLEAQLVHVFSVAFPAAESKAWFGGSLPRLDTAEEYRNLLRDHLERMEGQLDSLDRALEQLRPRSVSPERFLSMPPSRAETELLTERESLEAALARIRFFVDAEDREWIVRYPPEPGATLELVPLTVTSMARELLNESADFVVLSSAYVGRPGAFAASLGLEETAVRAFATDSPFPLAQRRIDYRPVGALSQTTLARLEPALFAEVGSILAAHPREKGLIHAPSYAAGRRLVADLTAREPVLARRLIWVENLFQNLGIGR